MTNESASGTGKKTYRKADRTGTEWAGKRTADMVKRRELRAIELRAQGKTLIEIAPEIGMVSVEGARNAILRGIERHIATATEEVRQLELARLDDLWRKNYERIEELRDPKAIDTALKIMDRRAKYLGLDAPMKVDLPNATHEGLNQMLSTPEGVALVAQVESFVGAQNPNDASS